MDVYKEKIFPRCFVTLHKAILNTGWDQLQVIVPWQALRVLREAT